MHLKNIASQSNFCYNPHFLSSTISENLHHQLCEQFLWGLHFSQNISLEIFEQTDFQEYHCILPEVLHKSLPAAHKTGPLPGLYGEKPMLYCTIHLHLLPVLDKQCPGQHYPLNIFYTRFLPQQLFVFDLF